jgi:hypothetical protein
MQLDSGNKFWSNLSTKNTSRGFLLIPQINHLHFKEERHTANQPAPKAIISKNSERLITNVHLT